MTPVPVTVDASRLHGGECWNAIGIRGDRTCPELAVHTHCRNCPVYVNAGRKLFERPSPEGYAAEWTERIAHVEAVPERGTLPVVLFRVGIEWFALDVSHAVEVATLRTIRRVPHQRNKILAGLVNIRGELQPAIHLGELLGSMPAEFPKDRDQERRLLVTECEGVRWVLMVDAVEDIVHFRRDGLAPLPATVAVASRNFTLGLFDWRDRTIGYLDSEQFYGTLARAFS